MNAAADSIPPDSQFDGADSCGPADKALLGRHTGKCSRESRRVFAVIALAVVMSSCDRGCDDEVTGPGAATFNSSGSASAQNLVRLTGEAIDADTVRVYVTLTGATTSSELYSFAFDIMLGNMPNSVTLVNGSELAGTVLQTTGSQLMTALIARSNDRIVVGVTKTGGGSGNAGPVGDATIIQFDLDVANSTTFVTLTLAGSPTSAVVPTNAPAALDPNGQVIGTVLFDTFAATVQRL